MRSRNWLDKAPAGAFALPKGAAWDDQTKPWLESDLEDCVMVSHDPMFLTDAGQPGPDGHLLNLKTGRLRRLPYEGFISMPVSHFPPIAAYSPQGNGNGKR